MTTKTLDARCRLRALHYLNPQTAWIAGLEGDVAKLQQFCAYRVFIDDEALQRLARHMGVRT